MILNSKLNRFFAAVGFFGLIIFFVEITRGHFDGARPIFSEKIYFLDDVRDNNNFDNSSYSGIFYKQENCSFNTLSSKKIVATRGWYEFDHNCKVSLDRVFDVLDAAKLNSITTPLSPDRLNDITFLFMTLRDGYASQTQLERIAKENGWSSNFLSKLDGNKMFAADLNLIKSDNGLSTQEVETLNKCIHETIKSCKVEETINRSNLVSYINSSKILFISTLLIFIGLMGTVFFIPLKFLFNLSIHKIILWIKKGK